MPASMHTLLTLFLGRYALHALPRAATGEEARRAATLLLHRDAGMFESVRVQIIPRWN